MKIFTPLKTLDKKLLAPYDFDFSGLVNAGYAKPNVDLNQTDLRDRIYIGAKWPEKEWANTLQLFTDKRQDLMATVDELEWISAKAKKDMKQFLSSFYEELNTACLQQELFTDK